MLCPLLDAVAWLIGCLHSVLQCGSMPSVLLTSTCKFIYHTQLTYDHTQASDFQPLYCLCLSCKHKLLCDDTMSAEQFAVCRVLLPNCVNVATGQEEESWAAGSVLDAAAITSQTTTGHEYTHVCPCQARCVMLALLLLCIPVV